MANNRLSTLALTLVMAIAARGALRGAEPVLSDSIRWDALMDSVVVTATRTPKLLHDVPVPTRIITSADIRRADVAGVAELLQQELPGIEFAWAMSREVSLNFGGFGGNDILFLIDGERMAGETMNNPDYQRLSVDNIERIEIVRGAASSLYGSNAVGGVINIITKRADKPVGLNINAHTGTHADNRVGATLSNRWQRWGNTLSMRYTGMGRYEMAPFSGAQNQTMIAERNHTWQFGERLMFQPTQGLTLMARAGYYFRERDYDASQSNRYRDFSAGVRAEWQPSAGHKLDVGYSFDQYDKSDLSLVTHYDVRDYSNVQNAVRAVYTGRVADGWTLTAGADVVRDYLISYMFTGSRRQVTTDVFAQADWEASPRVELVGGVRYDHYSASSKGSVTAKMAARWHVAGGLTLRASYSGGFRAPTLKEMYMDYNMAGIFMLYGNRKLQPERSHNLHLSAEYNVSGWGLTAQLHHNILSNRITTVWDAAANGLYGNRGAMCYRNISDMTLTTLEAGVARHFNRHWDVRASYSYNHVHVRSGELYSDDTRPHSLTARVGYTMQYGRRIRSDNPRYVHTLLLNLNARYLSALDVRELDNTFAQLNPEKTHYESYVLLKLSASLRIPCGLAFTLSADNLLNYKPKQYTYYSPKTTGTEWGMTVAFDL